MRGLGLPVIAGIGNRATDADAYGSVGVPASHTFAKLPEFQSELQPYLDNGQVVGFTSYDEIAAALAGL